MADIVEGSGNGNGVDLNEAARQLQQAAHDVRVAFDCIALDELDRAHTHAITARAAVDAAENALRGAIGGERSVSGGEGIPRPASPGDGRLSPNRAGC